MTLANGDDVVEYHFSLRSQTYNSRDFEISLGDYFNEGSGGLKIIYGGIKNLMRASGKKMIIK